jgi:hypothetical protein
VKAAVNKDEQIGGGGGGLHKYNDHQKQQQ